MKNRDDPLTRKAHIHLPSAEGSLGWPADLTEAEIQRLTYVDGSQDDLTRDLDVITDIAAGDYDPPPAA